MTVLDQSKTLAESALQMLYAAKEGGGNPKVWLPCVTKGLLEMGEGRQGRKNSTCLLHGSGIHMPSPIREGKHLLKTGIHPAPFSEGHLPALLAFAPFFLGFFGFFGCCCFLIIFVLGFDFFLFYEFFINIQAGFLKYIFDWR